MSGTIKVYPRTFEYQGRPENKVFPKNWRSSFFKPNPLKHSPLDIGSINELTSKRDELLELANDLDYKRLAKIASERPSSIRTKYHYFYKLLNSLEKVVKFPVSEGSKAQSGMARIKFFLGLLKQYQRDKCDMSSLFNGNTFNTLADSLFKLHESFKNPKYLKPIAEAIYSLEQLLKRNKLSSNSDNDPS